MAVAAATPNYQIGGLLEKMTNVDKDFRYMAVNDLMAELGKASITLDEDMEKRIVRALLALIQDKNGEVQNLACRCLGPLARKIKLQQLEFLVDSLCANLSSQNEQYRDTVLNELPAVITHQAYSCVKRVVPKLIETLRTDTSIKLEVLDVLGSLLLKYGRTTNLYFDEIEAVLFRQLEKTRSMQKRAILALGHLADVVPDKQFTGIVERLLAVITDEDSDPGILRTFILASITTCRSSPARLAPFLSRLVPPLIEKCKTVDDDDELRENCLQAFETFVFRCTTEMEPFASEITAITTELLCYDPNYNYGPEDEETEEMETDTASEPDGEQDDEYSDDDDLSWKVRRAAAKTIEALIAYRPDALSANYDIFGHLLISRFKEREDNVKYDIFAAYSALLKLTKQQVPELNVFQMPSIHGLNDCMPEFFLPSRFQQILTKEMNAQQREIFDKLKNQVAALMRALQKEFKGKNITTRLHSYVVLSNLVRAYPGILTDYLGVIMASVCSTLTENTTDGNVKIETLRFVTLILNTHASEDLQDFVENILPLLTKSIEDQFYKTSGEALMTTQSVLHVLNNQKASKDVNASVKLLYDAILAKLKVTDIDQEVKEKTISTTGLLVSLFSIELGSKITDECLPLLLDRLRNEMTRQVTLRAMNIFVHSQARLDLQPILPELLTLCSEFLRKNQRSLRLNTLVLLESLVSRFIHNGLQGPGLIKVVKEVPALISEQDLQISQIAITFITSVVNSYPDQILAEPLANLFKSLICLVQSSLLQGSTLNAALKLFTALIRSPLPNKPSFEEIVSKLSEPVYLSSVQMLHRQSYSSIAKATATIAHATGDQQKTTKLVMSLRDALSRPSTLESLRLFSILTLGEIGRQCGSVIEALEDQVNSEQLIIDSFTSSVEEIKSAASYALGSLASGNLAKFLPFLLQEISKEEKKQYLFLHALKEVINGQCSRQTGEPSFDQADPAFSNGIDSIWALLIKYCGSNEESIRNVVAECIGRLCIVNPQRNIAELLQHTQSPSANVRATVITALRFIVMEQPRDLDEHLAPVLGQFLATVRDVDLNVRRVAIVTLNSAAHNKPKLVKECLPALLPALYEETNVKQELVREVEMGPFKHTVDDGLDLRKAAFECMYTLADHCLDRVNLNEYLEKVEGGMKDCHDIKLLIYLMISRLVNKCPIQISQRLDGFCEQIKPQLLQRPKQNAVKQETDKQEELKRSAVRAVLALRRVPNSDRSQKMADLWEIINSNAELAAMKEQQTREPSIWAVNGNHEAMEIE